VDRKLLLVEILCNNPAAHRDLCLRRFSLFLRRTLWFSAALAVVVPTLLVPLYAATVSRRTRVSTARSQIGRSVPSSRLGISGESLECGVPFEYLPDSLSAGHADRDPALLLAVPCVGTQPVPVTWLAAFGTVAVPAVRPIRILFLGTAAPRGPPPA
jgi:hypothetical protein